MIKKNGGIFGRNPTYNDVVVEGVLTLKEAQVFDNDITINGDLTVNGTETVINTVELNVDDKNITMGAVVAKVGLAATTNITAGQFTVQLADTSGLIPGMTVTKTAGTGAFGASPKIASVDSHTQITLTVAHATSGTIIFDTGGATDDTADGGGITLKGTTDKFIKWVKASVAWVFSDPIKAPDVTVDNLTASKPVFTDANKKLTSTGTLAIDQGGTGKTTQQDAINTLAGAVTAAQFLRGDGTDVKMSAIQASDVPTLNQNTTGSANSVKSNATTGLLQIAGPGAGSTRVMTTPDANFTAARTDAAQTFTGAQTFGNIKLDTNTISSTNSNGNVEFTPNGTGYLKINHTPAAAGAQNNIVISNVYPDNAGGNFNRILWQNSFYGPEVVLEAGKTNSGSGASQLSIYTNEGVTLRERLRVTPAGALDMSLAYSGNIIMKSGNGIDFSATPGTGTSELLADYEEGVYTATLTPQTSGTIPLNSNYDTLAYTKVGRVVHVQGQIQIFNPSSPVGSYFTLSLPFTIANLTELSGRGGFVLNYQNTAVFVNWEGGLSYVYIQKSAASVANTDNLYVNFSYIAA